MEANDLKKISLIKKYRFLKSDLDWKKLVIDDSTKTFLEKACEKYSKLSALLNQDNAPNPVNESSQEEKPAPPKAADEIKKLYRDISKITHPDKDTEGKYTDLFKRASEAYAKLDYFEIFEICDELGIGFAIPDSVVEKLDLDISDMEKKLKEMSSSYVFKWKEAENQPELQEKIIDEFALITAIKNQQVGK